MSGLTAVVSSSMLFHSKVLAGQDLVPALKRAAILCDKIYVDLQGLGEPGGQLEDMFINTSFGGNAEEHDLTKDKQFKKLLLRPSDLSKSERSGIPNGFDYGKDPVYAQALDYVRGLDDDFFVPIAKPWRGVDYKARGSVALQLSEDILMPGRMRSLFPEAVGLLSPLHKKMLSSVKLPFIDENDPLVQLAAIRAVDYGALSWREILELRKSAFLTEFRLKLALIEKAGDANMQQELWGDLWGFAAENKPSPGKTVVSGLLANLPIGPVNPFSIGFALADTAKADTQKRKFGWLYFVMESNPDVVPSAKDGEDLSVG
ncbi:UNVERIFIED_ORG: hypothetical protein ABIB13_002214 [Arthrobacter sp. UYEF2]